VAQLKGCDQEVLQGIGLDTAKGIARMLMQMMRVAQKWCHLYKQPRKHFTEGWTDFSPRTQ